MKTPRPHDLLRISGDAAKHLPHDAPAWTYSALRAVPWVVVRRDDVRAADRVAVGVRGTSRSHRYALTLPVEDVTELITPECLIDADHGATRDLPALYTLRIIRGHLSQSSFAWGPTGSVGFELATGLPTATPDSDLDLILRVPDPVEAVLRELTALQERLAQQRARVDCRIDTRAGEVALSELLGGRPEVMVKTAGGPRLIARKEVLT